jgi:DAK2 domain fusion protein YloV
MLMGARGNSGVILSQLFRGIYKGLENYSEVNALELANAFTSGVAQAYKAVMKPVEGTILTVAREANEVAKSKINEQSSIQDYFKFYLEEARASLIRTPDLLPVLKEAGVVDSGATGYIYIVEGMASALDGKFVSNETISETMHTASKLSFDASSELVYGYCTEFILQLQHKKVDISSFDEKIISDHLAALGDSIVCVKDEDVVKVHVHTVVPGDVLNYCQQFGEYVTLKIENMSVQHTENQMAKIQCDCPECVEKRKNDVRKKYAVVAVASGEGLIKVFTEMGVDYVVSGGQSMNPSTDDFVKGFDSINADNIIVFPNNGNIIMAAKQAARYYKNANVVVIESKSIAQGYSALTLLDLGSDNIEEIVHEINQTIANVTTVLVTYSVRDADMGNVKIKKGDFIGILDSKIVASTTERVKTFQETLAKADLSKKEIITIIYGKDVNEKELEEIKTFIGENYSDLEIDAIDGKQDVYSYILSIE